jgi:hypothetical protein
MEINMKKLTVRITKRDKFIIDFVDSCGWARFDFILYALNKIASYDSRLERITDTALRVRINNLVLAGYLRRIRFLELNYFACTKTSTKYEFLKNMNYNRAEHDDFLIDFAQKQLETISYKSQREIRAGIGLGEKGPVPDLIVLDKSGNNIGFIEYEKTPKSTANVRSVIERLIMYSPRAEYDATIVFIFETAEIKNKYIKVLEEDFDYIFVDFFEKVKEDESDETFEEFIQCKTNNIAIYKKTELNSWNTPVIKEFGRAQIWLFGADNYSASLISSLMLFKIGGGSGKLDSMRWWYP